MLTKQKVAFLGAGSMAEAMISGISQSENSGSMQLTVTNRSTKTDCRSCR